MNISAHLKLPSTSLIEIVLTPKTNEEENALRLLIRAMGNAKMIVSDNLEDPQQSCSVFLRVSE